jgi:uncharacterized protein (DUF488 family)
MTGKQWQDLKELFTVHGAVEELDFDDEFADHMADVRRQFRKHAVSEREIREVHAAEPEYFENEGEGRHAPVIMLGPTKAGIIVAVPLEPTHRNGVWRPVTAFEANARDKGRYEDRRT